MSAALTANPRTPMPDASHIARDERAEQPHRPHAEDPHVADVRAREHRHQHGQRHHARSASASPIAGT